MMLCLLSPEEIHMGGSCLAAPNGEYLVEPVSNETGLVVLAEIDFNEVRREKVK